MIDRSTARTQPDRRFLPAAACTWTYVRAQLAGGKWCRCSYLRQETGDGDSKAIGGKWHPDAARELVSYGLWPSLLSASHRYRRDKLAKWPLQRPGDASRRLRPSWDPPEKGNRQLLQLQLPARPLKRIGNLARRDRAWVRHFDKPGRRALTS